MWFTNALITVGAWGAADLFYKKSSRPDDKLSHLRIVIAVGLVMGIHAAVYMLTKGISFNPIRMVQYFPVSAFYILSMALGYVGLRYVALSVSSPIQNTSGVLTAVLCFIFLTYDISGLALTGIILILIGIIAMAWLERETRIPIEDKTKKHGVIALLFPILYAIIDDLGTFADALYLDEYSLISEDDALIAYEMTFLFVAIVCFIYIRIIKKEKIGLIKNPSTLLAAGFETLGQYFYVFALADNSVVAAPMISAYSILSVILSRIFLKEKLTVAKYVVVAIVISGIILLGIE